MREFAKRIAAGTVGEGEPPWETVRRIEVILVRLLRQGAAPALRITARPVILCRVKAAFYERGIEFACGCRTAFLGEAMRPFERRMPEAAGRLGE